MTNQFDIWFRQSFWHPFLRLEDTHVALQEARRRLGRHKGSVNHVAHDLYVHAFNGWIINLSEFGGTLLAGLETMKQSHRSVFKRNRWKAIAVETTRAQFVSKLEQDKADSLRQRIAVWKATKDRAAFKRLWDTYFPKGLATGIPTSDDFDSLKAKFERLGKPIRDHRNTIAAHPAALVQSAATWRQVNGAIRMIRRVIQDLYVLATFDVLVFELPSAVADARRTGASMAAAMCGSEPSNVRRPHNKPLQPGGRRDH